MFESLQKKPFDALWITILVYILITIKVLVRWLYVQNHVVFLMRNTTIPAIITAAIEAATRFDSNDQFISPILSPIKIPIPLAISANIMSPPNCSDSVFFAIIVNSV